MKNLLLIALAAALTVVSAGAATTVVGLPADPGTGNCFPFGCAYAGGEYQQVYDSSNFTGGTITITQLLFYNTQNNSGATAMNSGTWTISFSTTAANHNTLLPVFASNKGANNTLVFSGNLSRPWAFGNTMTITLTTPFTYNPSQGNLLMDVVTSGLTAPGGNIYFDASGGGASAVYGRDYCEGAPCASGIVEGYGVVTGFVTGAPITSVPAASQLTLALMGLALLLTAAYGIRRKTTASARG